LKTTRGVALEGGGAGAAAPSVRVQKAA
jgi:hypothetical protein